MEFIKKYLIYGIYIIVILASIGIYAWSIMISGKNSEGFKSIESQYRTATSLGTKAVHDNEIQFYTTNIKKAEDDKKSIVDFCKMTSSRPYLFIKVFPYAPEDVSKQYYSNFATEYCKAVDNYIAVLHAGDKPSKLEETNYLNSSKRTVKDNNNMGGMERGGREAFTGAAGAAGSADYKLLVELREKRAQQVSIYANANSFALYDFWSSHDGSSGTTAALQNDSWFSQIAHWIQEDLVLSINKINSISEPVANNPVKRLVEISFNGKEVSSGTAERGGNAAGIRGGGGGYTPRGGVTGVSAGGSSVQQVVMRKGSLTALPGLIPDASSEADNSSSSRINTIIAKPWTERTSNDLLDVFQFKASVIMVSDRINDLINALQSSRSNIDGTNNRNQITVLQFNSSPISIANEEKDGYFYGAGSLVLVEVTCEYAFFKSGYEGKIPDSVINAKDNSANGMAGIRGY